MHCTVIWIISLAITNYPFVSHKPKSLSFVIRMEAYGSHELKFLTSL